MGQLLLKGVFYNFNLCSKITFYMAYYEIAKDKVVTPTETE